MGKHQQKKSHQYNDDYDTQRTERNSFKQYLKELEEQLDDDVDVDQWVVEELLYNSWEIVEVFDDEHSAENHADILREKNPEGTFRTSLA